MIELDIAGLSHTGCVRRSNQDRIAWESSPSGEQALLVLADGMGGHQGGEVASNLAVNAAMEALTPCLSASVDPASPDLVRERIDAAFMLASERVREGQMAEPELAKMGSTLVVVWSIGPTAFIAHVGDSRCYLLGGDQLTCLTRDDTVVQNMIEDGSITEEEAPRVPFRNVLTRAIGASDDATPSFRTQVLAPGDGLLLCSDGLPEAVPESDWLSLVDNLHDARERVDALLDHSLDNGAGDNVSMILLMLKN